MPPDDPDTIAFDIGWDFARFGRRMDAAVCSASLLTGYAAGREHFWVAQHRPDRFVSKWLQLRLNAFKRRRILCPDVDPSYLRRIDCDTCPITLVTLTRGALRDSDWSVDRINNDWSAQRTLLRRLRRSNRCSPVSLKIPVRPSTTFSSRCYCMPLLGRRRLTSWLKH